MQTILHLVSVKLFLKGFTEPGTGGCNPSYLGRLKLGGLGFKSSSRELTSPKESEQNGRREWRKK
jgi:hypothetical protein